MTVAIISNPPNATNDEENNADGELATASQFSVIVSTFNSIIYSMVVSFIKFRIQKHRQQYRRQSKAKDQTKNM